MLLQYACVVYVIKHTPRDCPDPASPGSVVNIIIIIIIKIVMRM